MPSSKEFKLHNLDKGPATTCTISKEEALQLYTQMQTIRRLETSAGNLYKEKIVRGFCHLYSGQEGCAVGSFSRIYIFGGEILITVLISYSRNESGHASAGQYHLGVSSARMDVSDGTSTIECVVGVDWETGRMRSWQRWFYAYVCTQLLRR